MESAETAGAATSVLPTHGAHTPTRQKQARGASNEPPESPASLNAMEFVASPPTEPSPSGPARAETVADLIDLLSSLESGVGPIVPESSAFNSSDFIENYTYHMDAHNLHVKEEEEAGRILQVIESRPPLDKGVFFMDTRRDQLQEATANGMLHVHGVSTQGLAKQMESRGYKKVHMSWYGGGSRLPERLVDGGAGPSGSGEVSSQVALKCKYPTCLAGKDVPTPAAQIIGWFEDK